MIEANACRDNIHLLVSIPSNFSVSAFMGYLKGKSSLMIFDSHANLNYRYESSKVFVSRFYRYGWGENQKDIRNQLREDYIVEQFHHYPWMFLKIAEHVSYIFKLSL